MRFALKVGLAMLAAPFACLAQAAEADSPPPVMQKVIACGAITDPAARLACFDSSVAELRSSQASGDLVVMDREQIKQTRRTLFGLTLPQLSLFDRHGDGRRRGGDYSDVKEISSTARQVSQGADGSWIVVLDDGARWQQTDSTTLGRFPKPGSTVLIRKGALNSYRMQVDHGVFMSVHRVM